GRVRVLAYVNHASMGSYDEALALAARTRTTPDVVATRRPGAIKWGVGFNGEQALGENVRAALRLGWNEGDHESFAYTEVNVSSQVGAEVRGRAWGRPGDRAGGLIVLNGISRAHRDYLSAGGSGFLLGDGALRYGPERIVESYYAVAVARGVSLSGDVQFIVNPGYNRDRGPVLVPGARLHVEF